MKRLDEVKIGAAIAMLVSAAVFALMFLTSCSGSNQAATSSAPEYVPKRDRGAAGMIVNPDSRIPNLQWTEDKARGVVCYKFDGRDGIACLKGFQTETVQ